MKITTKFNHGDQVQAILKGKKEITTKCIVCKGKTTITISEYGRMECPKCNGVGVIKSSEDDKWFVSGDDYYNFKINKIVVESYKSKKERSWTYCMSSSGGTMFDENNLFASRKEAIAECKKRNDLLNKKP